MDRLLDYDRRRYWLSNGWCLRFRVKQCPDHRRQAARHPLRVHPARCGHDTVARASTTRTAFRAGRPTTTATASGALADLVPYEFVGTDELICDFFDEVERACRLEGVPFAFDAEETERDKEPDDDDEVAA